MAELASQISSAVGLATNPSSTQDQRNEAYTFLTRVKEAGTETWQSCLALFLNREVDPQARMFGAQVTGESLNLLTAEMIQFVHQSLEAYFAQEFVSGNAESGVAYLINASVHLATLVFTHVYPTTAPTFLSSFLALARSYPPTTPTPTTSPLPLNPNPTNLLLRLLHEVASEISDAQLRLNKSAQQMAKDGELRDAIRAHDAPQIAAAIFDITKEALDGLDSPEDGTKVGLKGKVAREVGEMAVRVVADYVSWLDINLMVTPTSIPLLLRALHLPSPADLSIRIATADALIETVTKGMPAGDKIALLNVLDIGNVLARLIDIGREGGNTAESSEEVERFREKLAKLLNACGTELIKLVEDSSTGPDLQVTALAAATSLLPMLLRFLADAHDDTASSVFPFANSILSYYKKEKKRAAPTQVSAMTAEKQAFLAELLKVTLTKMQYKPDAEWEMAVEGEEDEDALLFVELRKNLRVIGDAIAWIEPELYSAGVRSIIVPTFDAFEAGGPSAPGLSWQQLELSLSLVYNYGQALSLTGPSAFVVVPPTEVQRSKQEPTYKIPYNQFPLSPLGELMLRTCKSKVVSSLHPAVSLQFFECTVRYSDFFRLCPEFIGEILPSFLDEHGLHQEDEAVRARVFYLFSRFVLAAKGVVQSQLSGEVITNILNTIQDLLTVDAELPSDEPATEEALTKAAKATTQFTAQLYVFEAVGTLVSILNQVPDQQVTLLRAVLQPLLAGVQANVRPTATTHDDYSAVLKTHHLIMAAGNVAKGFPDLSSRTPTANGAWVAVFRELTEGVLSVAGTMGNFLVIRDAARFAFNRIVATTGQAVLPLIPALIDCLLGQATFAELAELLSFLGLLVAKYKTEFVEILDTLLWPVFSRVFDFLKLPIAGTDDVVEHSSLRRAYFAFILSVISANLQQVFYSPTNQPHLQTVLQSVAHYISHDALATDQRFGFIVFNKLLQLWVDPLSPPAAGAAAVTPSPVPGFEQFFYSDGVKVCFEVTLKPEFDLGDAQSAQVVGEVGNLLKGLLGKRGAEFVAFLEGQLLPALPIPEGAGEAFVRCLRETPETPANKAFKKSLTEWLKACRG